MPKQLPTVLGTVFIISFLGQRLYTGKELGALRLTLLGIHTWTSFPCLESLSQLQRDLSGWVFELVGHWKQGVWSEEKHLVWKWTAPIKYSTASIVPHSKICLWWKNDDRCQLMKWHDNLLGKYFLERLHFSQNYSIYLKLYYLHISRYAKGLTAMPTKHKYTRWWQADGKAPYNNRKFWCEKRG